MQILEDQKQKLEQKKARIAAEEARLKLKERKARTRHLIELGSLITKAELDHLPLNALYGALLSLKKELDRNDQILSAWIVQGNTAFNKGKQNFTPVILKFASEPEQSIRGLLRSLGMRFNRFRNEWCGNIKEMDKLKAGLKNTEHNIEIVGD